MAGHGSPPPPDRGGDSKRKVGRESLRLDEGGPFPDHPAFYNHGGWGGFDDRQEQLAIRYYEEHPD